MSHAHINAARDAARLLDLSPPAAHVLLAISTRVGDDGAWRMRAQVIMDDTRYGRSTVLSAIAECETAGALRVERTPGQSSRYVVPATLAAVPDLAAVPAERVAVGAERAAVGHRQAASNPPTDRRKLSPTRPAGGRVRREHPSRSWTTPSRSWTGPVQELDPITEPGTDTDTDAPRTVADVLARCPNRIGRVGLFFCDDTCEHCHGTGHVHPTTPTPTPTEHPDTGPAGTRLEASA